MDFIKKNTWIIGVVVVAVSVIIVIATGKTPEGDLADTRDKNHVDFISQGDISKTELTQDIVTFIEKWQNEGFITKLIQSSHEVWVDGAMWDNLNKEAKSERALWLSKYMKTYDGTSQVAIYREGNNYKMAAEYFAGKLRVY